MWYGFGNLIIYMRLLLILGNTKQLWAKWAYIFSLLQGSLFQFSNRWPPSDYELTFTHNNLVKILTVGVFCYYITFYWLHSKLICLYLGRTLQNNQFTGSIDVLANLPLDNLCVSVVSYDIALFLYFQNEKLETNCIYCLKSFSGMWRTIILLDGYPNSWRI